MRQARIGIIGVGWWGTVGHLEPLADDPKTELVAVWSRTEVKAKSARNDMACLTITQIIGP